MSAERLKILVLEDNAADLRLLAEVLAEECGEEFQLQCETRLSKGLARLASEPFDAILLDLGLPDSQGFETFTRIRTQAPEVPVLLLTGLHDDEMAMRAVKEGAQDYIIKGRFDAAALVRSVRFAVERHGRGRRELDRYREVGDGKVLAFVGAKGGVGCTTVALNVAALIAEQKNTVTAVELRPSYGSFASHLKQAPAHNWGQLPESEDSPERALARTRFGFDVLYGPQKPDEFREISPDAARTWISKLSRRAAFTVIDLPGVAAAFSEAAVRLTNFAAVVTESDDSSLAAARLAVELLKSWGLAPSRMGLVIVNRAMLADAVKPQDVESELGCEVLGVVAPAPDACLAAQRAGTPLALLRPHSAFTNCLAGVAQKIVMRVAA
ncbi:MAG: response regulator [Acidobacteria bacterium]|nr:response regulator [Acidobacteriota bacterium]